MGTHKWAITAGAVIGGAVLLAGLGFGVSTIAAQGPEPTPTALPPQPPQGGNCPCGWSRREVMRLGWQMRGQAEIVAAALGMSVEELTAALREGKTVADLAAEKGVVLDTIVEALMAPRREALSQAVASGRLTQEQADRVLEQMRERITARLQQPWQDGARPGSDVAPERRIMWGGGMMGGRGRGRGISQPAGGPTQ